MLDFELRLRQATGAALAGGIVRAEMACRRDIAAFEQAGVAGKRG